MGQAASGGNDAAGGLGLALILLEGTLRQSRYEECMIYHGYTKVDQKHQGE